MARLLFENSRRDRLITLGHYLTAFVLVLEGVAHLGHTPTPWPFISLCWVSAATVAVVTLAHHQIERHFPALQCVIYLAEGSVSSALVYLTHHEGKVGLPYAWAIASAFLFGRAAWEFRHHQKARRSSELAPVRGTESDA